MISTIVHKLEPVALIGGGPVSETVLNTVRRHAPFGVAADGGAAHMMQSGWHPEHVIGDMDSLDPRVLDVLPKDTVHTIAEQDSTDFEKCLMRLKAPVILGAGFQGGRLDHELAAYHALVRFCEQRCVLLSDHDAVFVCPPQMELSLEIGTPLSLFPLGQVTGRTDGLEWSFEALDYAPGGRIGTSNRVTGPVQISMSAPCMLCIVPAHQLGEVVKQLAAQHGERWPARA